MNKFKDLSIITDGKFVGVVKYHYCNLGFFFGVYNHKYFSFCPQYPVYGVGTEADFRVATFEEVESFKNDCKTLGYDIEVFKDNSSLMNLNDNSISFEKFVSYNLMTKSDFLSQKMPKYVPFYSFVGRTVIKQFRWNDYIMWIFSDNAYTKIQIAGDFDGYADFDVDIDYDKEDEYPGETLIDMWDCNRKIQYIKDNDIVGGEPRVSWWYLASNCVRYNFYYETDNTDKLDAEINDGKFSELGQHFIELGIIDVKFIRNLCHEYFYYNRFRKLADVIKKKAEYEKSLKQNTNFDL